MTKKDEAMQMLDQLENALFAIEKDVRCGFDTGATSKTFLMFARAVYWLLERWIREKGD